MEIEIGINLAIIIIGLVIIVHLINKLPMFIEMISNKAETIVRIWKDNKTEK